MFKLNGRTSIVLGAAFAVGSILTSMPAASPATASQGTVAAKHTDTSCDADAGFSVGTGPMPAYVAHPASKKVVAERQMAVRVINDSEFGNAHFGCARYDGQKIIITVVEKQAPATKKLIERAKAAVPRGTQVRIDGVAYSSLRIHETRNKALSDRAELQKLGMNGLTGWYDGQSLHLNVSPSRSAESIAKIRALLPEPYVVVDKS